MHEEILARAALPEPPRIFRVKLKPYSLGHELHLYRRGSAFLTKSYTEFSQLPRATRFAQTMMAVSVCSRTFDENRRDQSKSFLWLWKKIAPWMNLGKATEDFWLYIMEGRKSFPSALPDHTEGMKVRHLGAPMLINYFHAVNCHTPQREVESYGRSAWDYPLGLAAAEYEAREEMAGRLEIYNICNRMEEQMIAELEKEREDKGEPEVGISFTQEAVEG